MGALPDPRQQRRRRGAPQALRRRGRPVEEVGGGRRLGARGRRQGVGQARRRVGGPRHRHAQARLLVQGMGRQARRGRGAPRLGNGGPVGLGGLGG